MGKFSFLEIRACLPNFSAQCKTWLKEEKLRNIQSPKEVNRTQHGKCLIRKNCLADEKSAASVSLDGRRVAVRVFRLDRVASLYIHASCAGSRLLHTQLGISADSSDRVSFTGLDHRLVGCDLCGDARFQTATMSVIPFRANCSPGVIAQGCDQTSNSLLRCQERTPMMSHSLYRLSRVMLVLC